MTLQKKKKKKPHCTRKARVMRLVCVCIYITSLSLSLCTLMVISFLPLSTLFHQY